MTGDILLTLLIAAGGFALFLWGRLRVDVVGLIDLLLVVAAPGVIPRFFPF